MTTVNRMSGGTGPRKFTDLTVSDIMEQKVQLARGETRVDALASLMVEGFGSVPIVDEQQRVIGVVSEHDLLAALDRGQRWGDLTALDIMSRNPYSVRKETSVSTLIHVFKASDLIRVPVVDARNQLVGIVARRDVVRACLESETDTKP